MGSITRLEKLLIDEDSVILPLYQRGSIKLVRPYVKNIFKHSFGGDYTYKYTDTRVNKDGKKILRLLDSSDIPSMDTNKATNSVSFEVMSNVLEGLYSFGENDVLEPALAKSWDVSEDSLHYIFNLRQDCYWSNGDEITAHDFVYSWRRLADPATGSQYAFMVEIAGIKNGTAIINGDMEVESLGVEALGDYALEVTLEHPVPFFRKLMTFPNFYPVNQKFVESVGDGFGTTIQNTLYNGPFILNSWDIGKGYSFVKNPDYWNSDEVILDEVNYKIVKDVSSGIALYESGHVDIAALSGEYYDKYKDNSNQMHIRDTALFYIIFNQDVHVW